MKNVPYAKISLYLNDSIFLLVGRDIDATRYQLVEIKRNLKSKISTELSEIYSKQEALGILKKIKEDTKKAGSEIVLFGTYCGLVGFIKFDSYYILMAKSDGVTGHLEGHKIKKLSIEAINFDFLKEYDAEEPFISCLNNFISSEMFYYSPTCDLSLTLQQTKSKQLFKGKSRAYYIWNRYLRSNSDDIPGFYIDLFFGHCETCDFTFNDSHFSITIIARRSNRFAGVRYRRRGINKRGFVGNEVETEIIVSHYKDTEHKNSGNRNASFVIYRGSVPLAWNQPNNKGTHPPIVIEGLNRPASDIHINRLKRDYGDNITVVSLLRTHEANNTEKDLDLAYKALSNHYKLSYKEFDFLYYEKNNVNTNLLLERMVERDIAKVNYFVEFDGVVSKRQEGVFRVNCVDCLDRTNAAQYYITKLMLKEIIPLITSAESIKKVPEIEGMLSRLFNDQANYISKQYGGSDALHQHVYKRTSSNKSKIEKEKVMNFTNRAWNFFSSAKRMINNTLWDGDKQRGYNLFLGSYIYGVNKEHFTTMKSTTVLDDWDTQDLVPSMINSEEDKKVDLNEIFTTDDETPNRKNDLLDFFEK